MATAVRMLLGIGAGPTHKQFPTDWNVTEFAGNPIITVGGGEPNEQYDPAPIQLASQIVIYIKGAIRIYAYGSDDVLVGEDFSGLNGGSEVIGVGTTGTWDDTYALEPAAYYDGDTIHVWYKGSTGGANDVAWGYATADDSNPVLFTKDPGNPILTTADLATQIGGSPDIDDTAPFDVFELAGVWHFFGYAQVNGRYRLIHMTGAGPDDPDVTTLDSILIPPNDATLAGTGSVFKYPGGDYGMFYTYGALSGTGRHIRVGRSADLDTWDFSDTTPLISQSSGWEADWAYTPRLLREPGTVDPVIDGMGRWKLYYSGMNLGANQSQGGLAYLEPS